MHYDCYSPSYVGLFMYCTHFIFLLWYFVSSSANPLSHSKETNSNDIFAAPLVQKEPPKIKDHHAYIRDFCFAALNLCVEGRQLLYTRRPLWHLPSASLSTVFQGQMINKIFWSLYVYDLYGFLKWMSGHVSVQCFSMKYCIATFLPVSF